MLGVPKAPELTRSSDNSNVIVRGIDDAEVRAPLGENYQCRETRSGDCVLASAKGGDNGWTWRLVLWYATQWGGVFCLGRLKGMLTEGERGEPPSYRGT